MISRSFFGKHVRKRFLAIPGRSVRADLIGRQFWANPADFGKNRRFPGFGSMDLRVIAASVRDFRRFAVDRDGENALSGPGIWISLKCNEFPGFALIRSIWLSY